MTKKIVAIGGGENGRIISDGTCKPYETGPIDQEIINLTGKEKPHFLFLAHSQDTIENENSYFETMQAIYNGKYGCECKHLLKDQLNDIEYAKSLVNWADIIYEGGGNTLDMIKLWKDTGFDKILYNAWNEGKVLCGLSAGANCWFEACSSDSLQIKFGPDQPLISMECLGFLKGFLVPHCDEPGRIVTAKEFIKEKEMVGFFLSNCSALEIIDDTYRVIYGTPADKTFKPYAIKAYWQDEDFIEEKLEKGRKNAIVY